MCGASIGVQSWSRGLSFLRGILRDSTTGDLLTLCCARSFQDDESAMLSSSSEIVQPSSEDFESQLQDLRSEVDELKASSVKYCTLQGIQVEDNGIGAQYSYIANIQEVIGINEAKLAVLLASGVSKFGTMT